MAKEIGLPNTPIAKENSLGKSKELFGTMNKYQN